mgnify:FL=1
MSIQQREFSRFIKLLSDNDCLEHVIKNRECLTSTVQNMDWKYEN